MDNRNENKEIILMAVFTEKSVVKSIWAFGFVCIFLYNNLCTIHGMPVLVPLHDGNPDSKDHGANMGPTWVLSAPDGPHVGPMNLTIREIIIVQARAHHWHTTRLLQPPYIVRPQYSSVHGYSWTMYCLSMRCDDTAACHPFYSQRTTLIAILL